MNSDRKVGSRDWQEKNEAKQHGGVSLLVRLGFTLIYAQLSASFQNAWHSFVKQHTCPDIEVMGKFSGTLY